MKKQTGFQNLFDELPLSLIAEDAPAAAGENAALTARVWERTASRCGIKAVKRGTVRRLWMLPAVAILLAAAMVTALAFAVYSPPPVTYSFLPPSVQDFILPLPSEYEHAVPLDAVTENNGLRVSMRCFTADTLGGELNVIFDVASTDGAPLAELSSERLSVLNGTFFTQFELMHGDGSVRLFASGEYVPSAANLWRVDNGDDPCVASFLLRYYVGGDAARMLDADYALQFTDLIDVVRVTPDLGFLYPSMQELYAAMTPAAEEDYRESSVRFKFVEGDVWYYQLADSGRALRFSEKLADACIDNIGFRTDPFDEADGLYIAYSGLPDDLSIMEYPVLIDMRDGVCYSGVVTPERDGDRVTVLYGDITEDMLPHLFMMQGGEREFVTRASGTWTVPFTVGAQDGMTVHSYTLDETITSDGRTVTVTALHMNDSTLYVEAVCPENEELPQMHTREEIWQDVKLVMADGSVKEDIFYNTVFAEVTATMEREIRYGGALAAYTDTAEVVAVILCGKRIELIP